MNDDDEHKDWSSYISESVLDMLETGTEGGKLIHRFLREISRTYKDYPYWYEPQIGPAGIEPDFILY